MKRVTLSLFCLAVVASLGFWRLTAQPEPFVASTYADGVNNVEFVDHRKIEQLERHLKQLIHEAEKLEDADKQEQAERVHQEIERIEKHLHQMHEQAEHHEEEHHFAEAEQKRDHLLEAAENLRHADKPELAKKLQHEAEEIERHLHHLREREHGHHPHNPMEPVLHELHGLRKEVAELREQIHELHEVIEEAIEEDEDEEDEDIDDDQSNISVFELESGDAPIINENGLKVFIKQFGKQQAKGAKGKVQVHGKVQIKGSDSDDVQVFVFDQDDLEAGDLSKMLNLNELELGTETKGLNLKSIIEQALENVPNAKKKGEESKSENKD